MNDQHDNWGCDWNVDSLRRRFWNGQSAAHAAVNQAIKKGTLKSPKEFPCKDCGVPSTDYDHRDYGKPLKVVAVCRSCNLLRGRAFPKRWLPEEAAVFARQQVMKCCDWKMATNPDLCAFDQEWHNHNWVLAKKTALAHWVASRQAFRLRDVAYEIFSESSARSFETFATDEILAINPWMHGGPSAFVAHGKKVIAKQEKAA